MTAPNRHLDRLRAQRLFGIVTARGDAYGNLAMDLPHWLRHNGLAHTLDYLRFLGAENGRDQAAARDLLRDWWSSAGTQQGWHLALTAAEDQPHDSCAAYRQASRLALREADWLKRYVQSVLRADAIDEPCDGAGDIA